MQLTPLIFKFHSNVQQIKNDHLYHLHVQTKFAYRRHVPKITTTCLFPTQTLTPKFIIKKCIIELFFQNNNMSKHGPKNKHFGLKISKTQSKQQVVTFNPH